jgi:hypothetical protein
MIILRLVGRFFWVGWSFGRFWKNPMMRLVDMVHAGYIADLSLVRISYTDAMSGRQYNCTQTGTEAGINSRINVPSIVCVPRVSTKHCAVPYIRACIFRQSLL